MKKLFARLRAGRTVVVVAAALVAATAALLALALSPGKILPEVLAPLGLVGSAQYRQMRKVTRSNYSHFLRDLVFRCVARDWPQRRAVRLERWMLDREPAFFERLERRLGMAFEVVPDRPFFEKNCTSGDPAVANLMGDAFRDGDETHREDGASREQKKKPKRMVWLSRGKDDARRAIVNEEKVYDELSEKACCDGSKGGVGPLEFLRVGVDAGKLGNDPISEQAAMFADVDVLVSLHGAGLTNMLFMPRGGLVVEIMPGTYEKPTYRGLAGLLGLRYERVYTEDIKPGILTRVKYAFNSPEDRERKFRRDALITMQPKEAAEIENILAKETSQTPPAR